MKQICLATHLSLFLAQGVMSQGIKYTNENSVVITLSELESDQIPSGLWDSLNINELKIQKFRPDSTWTTHPPLSWFESREFNPPYWSIPEGIEKLKNLESLHLVNLDINKLRNSITNLEKLEILDLSLNKLELSEALPKLKNLKNLKVLRILGNHYKIEDMERLEKEFLGTKIEYRQEIN